MIIDILIILAFLFCVFRGFKKGFAKTIIGLCSYVVAMIICVFMFDTVKGMLYENAFFADKIEQVRLSIANSVESHVFQGVNELPTFLKCRMGDIGGDFATEISLAVVEAIVAVLFFVAILIAIKLLSLLISGIVKMPVLKQFNSILGGAVGALNGVMVCYIFGAVLIFAFTSFDNNWMMQQINDSVIGEFFFKNNFILNILIGL